MITRREFSKSFLAAGTALLAAGELTNAGELQTSSSQSAAPDYDLLIKGGTVIDPAQRLHGLFDVAVKDGKVLAVSQNIAEGGGGRVVSAKDKIVTPGLIDIHVHCFYGMGAGANADHFCLGRGVTTVVDAGSVGYPLIGAFIRYIVNTSVTRIYALIDIGALGTLVGIQDAMNNLDWVNPELTAKAAELNKPTVVGVKVRLQKSIEGTNDIECLKRALQAASFARLPLMAHIDDPYSPMGDLLEMMRKGDIVTHYMNGHPHGVLDANGKVLPEARDARARGVLFDPAEGSTHFSFDVMEKCLAQDFVPDTISTDLVNTSEFGAVGDLPTQISKFLALGMSLDNAIEKVTFKASQVFDYGLPLGTLKPGTGADIGIFEVRDGRFDFGDTEGQKRTGRQMLISKAVVRQGQYFVNEY